MTESQTMARASAFPVEWDRPEEAQLFWTPDIMHFPEAVSPLGATFEVAAIADGLDKATAEMSMPLTLRYKVINGYVYSAVEMRSADPAVLAAMGQEAEKRLGPAVMQMESRWKELYLPELKRDIETFRAFDYARATDAELADHVAWAIDRRYRLYYIHFIATFPAIPLPVIFADTYQQITGSTDEMEPLVLLQGFANRTVEAGHGLWSLSRDAKRSPEVLEALDAKEPGEVFARLARSEEGRAFAEAFRDYLDEFGWRGDSWIIDDRTWIDYPRTPLATLHGYLAKSDDESPETEHARLVEERDQAVARVREKLAGAPAEARAQFEGLLRAAQFTGVIQEDHNYYIDQMLQHLARRAFVEAGKRMAGRLQIEDPEDVLYLTADELKSLTREAGGRDLRSLIDDRSATLTRWRMFSPPPAIGTPPPPPPADYKPNPVERGLMRFFGGPPQVGTQTEIRGNAGSKGKVTGIARVARTLAEATDLQAGEILVCPTTSPPWTPLFATAAAVVTDTGGILSHCAVVAREFGIPAVVGTGVATHTIKTGQRVTVDGSAGTVTLE